MIGCMERARNNLRQATADDRDFLWNLNVTAMKQYVEETWGWHEPFQRSYFAKHFEPSSRQVVSLDGIDVGTLCIDQRESCLFVKKISVPPEHQTRGVATALLLDALNEASQRGVPCELQVLKVNPARALYERLGFRITGKTETHYLMSAAAPGIPAV